MKGERRDFHEVVIVEAERVNALMLLFFQHPKPELQLALYIRHERFNKVFDCLVTFDDDLQMHVGIKV